MEGILAAGIFDQSLAGFELGKRRLSSKLNNYYVGFLTFICLAGLSQLQHSSIILPSRSITETKFAASFVDMPPNASTASFTASRTAAGILFEDLGTFNPFRQPCCLPHCATYPDIINVPRCTPRSFHTLSLSSRRRS